MNFRTVSLSQLFVLVMIGILGGSSLLFMGCSGSEETMEEEAISPYVANPMQKTIDSLQAENASLLARVARLEQDKRSLTAQVAELETKIAEAAQARETPPPPPLRTGDSRTEYDNALSLFRQRNYQEAMSVWMGLLNTSAPEGLESNCHYWIGECYYATREYTEALSYFQHVLGYSHTTKKDDAQLMTALCYERMGDRARAKQEYQKLIDQYPASPYIQRAKDRVARM
jgi:TolA-binding protein